MGGEQNLVEPIFVVTKPISKKEITLTDMAGVRGFISMTISTFSSMTSLDVYFDAHATQLELSFRSDVWRAFTYLHVWDKAFLDKKRVFV